MGHTSAFFSKYEDTYSIAGAEYVWTQGTLKSQKSCDFWQSLLWSQEACWKHTHKVFFSVITFLVFLLFKTNEKEDAFGFCFLLQFQLLGQSLLTWNQKWLDRLYQWPWGLAAGSTTMNHTSVKSKGPETTGQMGTYVCFMDSRGIISNLYAPNSGTEILRMVCCLKKILFRHHPTAAEDVRAKDMNKQAHLYQNLSIGAFLRYQTKHKLI